MAVHFQLFAAALAVALASVRVAWGQQLQVHIVPHTHDDVGWLKTVDQYYYGANNSIQNAGVQYILDTVIRELSKDDEKTFIYVEMAFFTRWWNEQDDKTQQLVKTLVNNKQLEFVNAGWCMNDEASTDYNSIIDQMSLGLRFVNDTFGPQARPRVAWHIDPFGHSAEQAAIFAKMGFDGFFFARLDYDDWNKRLKENTAEMVWRGSPSLGAESDLFTGVLYYFYGYPPGFCYDVGCDDPPIQDDPDLFDYNVPDRVNAFVAAAMDQAQHYTTHNIMMTFGMDFNYQNAHENFKNIDKLIKYVNQDGRVHAFYSTPSRYIDAVHAANKTWTLKTDDFFPYADGPYHYWTGYFTSRPALKGYTRVCNNILQACKQLEAIHNGFQSVSSMSLQMALGVDQHHDAVSGTSKQHVAYDYAKRLHIGQVECEELMGYALSDLAAKDGSPPLDLQFCEYLNISVCSASQNDSFNIIAYSPYCQLYSRDMAFPVNSTSLVVYNGNGDIVPSQVVPIDNSTSQVVTDALYLLHIYNPKSAADAMQPLGFQTYFVRPSNGEAGSSSPSKIYVHKNGDPDFSISNEVFTLTFDGVTGRLKSIANQRIGYEASVDQQFMWWNASDGNNVNDSQASGAYIFRPNGTAPFPINPGNIAQVTVVSGDVVQEVRQVFSPWVTQTIRLFSYNVPVFEYTIGPIPKGDGLGKEVISRFSTNLTTGGVWYTDANGREMQKRVRNYRPTWTLNVTEPVAGNYYPVNSRIYIQDVTTQNQFTVITDRSHGGSSLNDGQVELMVHRCLLYDDSKGVGEPLCEPGDTGKGLVVRGTHVVILDDLMSSINYRSLVSRALTLGPMFALQPSTGDISDYITYYNTNYTGLTTQLPFQLNIATLQFLSSNTLLLRLEHVYQIDDPAPFNNPVTVTLDNMFTGFSVVSVTELVLGANENIDNVQRLQWNVEEGSKVSYKKQNVFGPSFAVTLNPIEIRTFELEVKMKQ